MARVSTAFSERLGLRLPLIAAPMAGGIFTSFVLELVVYPAIYEIWKWHFELKRAHAEPQSASLVALPSPEAL